MPDSRSGSAALLVICSLGVLAAAGAPPARADWIVTRQGARIETRGPWREKGKLVVFSLPDGKLSSLRLSEIDLEASRAATHAAVQAKEQPQEPVKPRRESIAKLTDKDFQHAPAAVEAHPGGAAPEKAGADHDKKPGGVVVGSWDRGKAPEDGHVVINGTVHNTTADQATAIAITVRLFDDAGTPLAKGEAVLTSTILPAGGSGGFKADFPGLFTFAAAKFEPRSLNLATKPGQPSALPNQN